MGLLEIANGGCLVIPDRSPVQPTRSETVPEWLIAAVGAQLDMCVDRLNAVHALVERYRKVSSSPNAQCYLRDVEVALGMDLPPVKDSDGRTNW